MTTQEIDRIEKAINHVKCAADPWASVIAVMAMRKQIPKKPIEKPDKYNENLWHLYCPSCENWIGIWNNRVEHGDMHNTSNSHICPYCGQAIDLREE